MLPFFLTDALEPCSDLGIGLLGDVQRFQEFRIGAFLLFQIQK